MRKWTVLAAAVIVLVAGLSWSQYNAASLYQHTDGSSSPETISWSGVNQDAYPNAFTVYSNAAFFMKRMFANGTEDADSFQVSASTGFTSPGKVSGLIFYGQSDTIDVWGWYR